MRRNLELWSRSLLWTLAAVAGVAVLGVLGGLAMVIADEASHSDDWDGLGTLIGLIAAVIALVVAVVAGGLALTLRAGRRENHRGLMTVVSVLTLVIAAVALGWSITMAASGDAGPGLIALLAVGSGAVALTSAGTLVCLRQDGRPTMNP